MARKKLRTEQKQEVKNGVRRLIFAALGMTIQILYLVFFLLRLGQRVTWLSGLVNLLALFLVLMIYVKESNAGFKMPWIILIAAFPLIGVVVYALMGQRNATRATRRRFNEINEALQPILMQDVRAAQELDAMHAHAVGIAHYLHATCGYPVYKNTKVEYYDDGAKGLEAQLAEMRKAQSFIFLEYHAIEDGSASFDRIKEVLAEKAKEGVEVRLFYDEVGSIGFINRDFVKRMEALGIKTRIFNPVMPAVAVFMNNRDHRKITVIDGKIAFTGGYNLADEYFNITSPYGHWKDCGIRMEGDAVRTMTTLFLEMWNAINKKDEDDVSYEKFYPETDFHTDEAGFVQPFADSPLDLEPTGENVYMAIANNATKYLYFSTPYLILTDEFSRAIAFAAERGIDVRIVTPGIPDKKITYRLTRSYYAPLVKKGVRIYEYTPGICHAKLCLSDDEIATVGTINLDYRSLYLHFENGVVLYDKPAIKDIYADFQTLFEKSEEVTCKYSHGSTPLRIGYSLLRLLSPLM